MAYLIRRSQVTPQQADWLTKLELAAQHLLELINAVLDLSKIESGKLALNETQVSLPRIAAHVVSMLLDAATGRQLTLNVKIRPMPQGLLGDAARLQQALLNYAANAVKFTHGGTVTLRAACVEDTPASALLRFEVQDTGIGIAPEVLPRRFRAFEQADNSTTRQYGGTGLGSTFWFATAQVLVVDEDEVNRVVTLALMATALPHTEGMADGLEALRRAALNPYDLIPMDVHMTDLDGLETTRRMRDLPGCAATTSVVLTANVFAEDRRRCLEAGMDDFLTNPVVPEPLFETVMRWLLRARAAVRGCSDLRPEAVQ